MIITSLTLLKISASFGFIPPLSSQKFDEKNGMQYAKRGQSFTLHIPIFYLMHVCPKEVCRVIKDAK